MEADRFIRERGGRLYVWLQPFGRAWSRLSVGTKPPTGEPDLQTVHAGGFELLLDSALERPNLVEVSLRRRPWKRLRVRGLRVEGYAAGGGDPGGWDDHGVLWDSGGGGGGGGGGNGGGGNGGGG